MATLNHSILEAALEGLEDQRKRLDEHIASVRAMLGNRGTARASADSAQARKPRRLSAEGRKRIAEAQRKRWAAQKKWRSVD